MTHGMVDTQAIKATELQLSILERYQDNFPVTERPYADIAVELGVTEFEVLAALRDLESRGALNRVGSVVQAGAVGASTLAAMTVPMGRLEEVASIVNSYEEVNHNYERDARLNLWFVVVAETERRKFEILAEITERSGLEVMYLPMEASYQPETGLTE